MADPETPGVGDNSAPTKAMRAYLERIERLEEEKSSISEDIKGVWDEAKNNGVDVKALRKVHSLRKLDDGTRNLVGLYADRLGVFA